ncbi:MAG: hypothetical protein ACXAEX_20915 [Promethearchaeota archaeon]
MRSRRRLRYLNCRRFLSYSPVHVTVPPMRIGPLRPEMTVFELIFHEIHS